LKEKSEGEPEGKKKQKNLARLGKAHLSGKNPRRKIEKKKKIRPPKKSASCLEGDKNCVGRTHRGETFPALKASKERSMASLQDKS